MVCHPRSFQNLGKMGGGGVQIRSANRIMLSWIILTIIHDNMILSRFFEQTKERWDKKA